MRIHAIETGRVRIKQAQIEGRGHGLWRQMQPMISSEWADWSPVYAWAIEHPEGVIVVDTGSAAQIAAALASVFSICRALRYRARAGGRPATAPPRHQRA
jgi:hypothetical protein